ncbi:MAG: bifunctional riboflavin kinase/FAD synthetase [Gammaproteobacteria bacterium]|nr:bifunctional riboflavin kinase/FAD synthetase [Gammaproteobacteria bacterium]
MAAELIRGLYNLAPLKTGCVVTIGNFDGVHRGHQALLEQVKARAEALGVPSVVITFEPQPIEYFAGGKSDVPRLMRWREKFYALSQCGIDKILFLRFNRHLAGLTADEFIEELLVKGLNAKDVLVGDDFRFGKARQGDFEFLKKAGEKNGFAVENMTSVVLNGERISSTRIREALAVADHDLVKHYLGQPYSMKGRVVHGHKRGRSIGFPTANINLHRHIAPVKGVYAVRMHGVNVTPITGVANVGVRPTIGGTRSLLEVHLFDFDQDIYGKHVCVEFCKKLRDEKRYDSFELLKEQIVKDAEQARAFFVAEKTDR